MNRLRWGDGNSESNGTGEGALGLQEQQEAMAKEAMGQRQRSIITIAIDRSIVSVLCVRGRGEGARQHDRFLFRVFYLKKLVNAKKRSE
jgi:hypothetical protein